MVKWEYCIEWSSMEEVNRLAADGWIVHAVTIPSHAPTPAGFIDWPDVECIGVWYHLKRPIPEPLPTQRLSAEQGEQELRQRFGGDKAWPEPGDTIYIAAPFRADVYGAPDENGHACTVRMKVNPSHPHPDHWIRQLIVRARWPFVWAVTFKAPMLARIHLDEVEWLHTLGTACWACERPRGTDDETAPCVYCGAGTVSDVFQETNDARH